MGVGGICARQPQSGNDWVLRTEKQGIDTERSCGLSRSIEEISRWIEHFSIFA